MTELLYQDGVVVGSTEVSMIGNVRVANIYRPFVETLIAAAAKDGVTLTLDSGLRTQYEQIWLRLQNAKDRTKVKEIRNTLGAIIDYQMKEDRDSIDYIMFNTSDYFHPATGKPGHSNHQNGRAYDFRTKDPKTNLLIKSTIKNGVVKMSPYHWLVKNMFRFGFVRTVPTTYDPHGKVINEGERWHIEYRGDQKWGMFAKVPIGDPTWDGMIDKNGNFVEPKYIQV